MSNQITAPSSRWRLASLVAFTILAGVQLMRALFPLLLFVLRERFSWQATEIGALVFALFLLTLLAAPLSRWLGGRRLLVVAVAVTGLARLLLQWWGGDPLVDMLVAMVGVLAFGLALPPLAGWLGRDGRLVPALALGVLGGLALDLGLHGVYATYDMHWLTGLVPALLVTAFVALQLLLLWLSLRGWEGVPADLAAANGAWLALGPMLFFYLLSSGNLASLHVISGWAPPPAFLLLLLSHLLGLALFFWPDSALRGAVLPAAALLLAWHTGVYLFDWAVTGNLPAIMTLATQPVAAGLWLLALRRWRSEGAADNRLGRLAAANTGALVIMAALLFIYYASYDIALPLPREVLPAAGLFLLLAISVPGWRAPAPQESNVWLPWAFAFSVLLILPLIRWRDGTPVALAAPGGEVRPVRVMTYNLHNGFNPEGNLDLETLARTIEDSDVDVVGLQEVSRGWVINGSVDMLTWLAQRLEMQYAFAPSAGPFWGNAVLTRLPIVSTEAFDLPPDNLLLTRGVLAVTVDTGGGQTLTVAATHYHHSSGDSDIRQAQSATIVARWPAPSRAVLIGDMNATPESPEMALLAAAGWQESLAVNGRSDTLTFPAAAPTRQIDYIWVSPDLRVGETVVLPVADSDHRPVVSSVE